VIQYYRTTVVGANGVRKVRRIYHDDGVHMVALEKGFVDAVYYNPWFDEKTPKYYYCGEHSEWSIYAMRLIFNNDDMMRYMTFNFRPFGGGYWQKSENGYVCDYFRQNKINS
jgi:hypothetical protein